MHCVCAQQDDNKTSDDPTRNRDGSLWSVLTCRKLFKKRGPKFTMPKGERTMKAAILIQKWYRRYLARMEVRRRYTWTIFQSLEYAGEQDEVQLYNFFSTLLARAPTPSGPLSSTDPGPPPDSDDPEGDEGFGPVEPGYKGPRVDFPLTREGLDTLLAAFRRKKPYRVHAHYAWGILREATTVLRRLPNLNLASTEVGKQVTICGDLHGKLSDLLVILHKNGLPSAENPYVFNGDFVDRGKRSMEVLLLLCALLIVFPGVVFLNRGNHEDRAINVRYGFIREVRTKYRLQSERLLKQIERLYRALPIGSLVDGKVLVVHGGISDQTDLNMLWTIDRFKFSSLMDPPQDDKSDNENEESVEKREWKQIFDVLWSDPQAAEGCAHNSMRGAGTYFGPDVTANFLSRHNLLLLVRSHECKLEGYEITHNNKCITIFSASDYYEVGSNKGAYVKLAGSPLTPQFVQFQVSGAKGNKARRLTFRQRVGLVERSALRSLAATIETKRSVLEAEFKNKDPKDKGVISIADWCEAMQAGTGLAVPWRLLRERVLSPEAAEEAGKTGLIKYNETFCGPGRQSGVYVTEALYRDKLALESLFSAIDTDHSGTISMTELKQACALLPEGAEPGQLSARLARCLDFNQDGRVDLNEFLEAFRLVDASTSARNASLDTTADSPEEDE